MASTATLAFWRVRQNLVLLFLIGAGVLAAVVLVCTVPLYSQVAMTAGLHSTLTTTSTSADIVLHTHVAGISIDTVHDIPGQLASLLPTQLPSYLSGTPQFSLQTQSLTVLSPRLASLQLFGSSMEHVASHTRLIRGRLPSKMSNDIEIAVTPETAAGLEVTVGSEIAAPFSFFNKAPDPLSPSVPFSQRLHFHVVGLFTTVQEDDPFWHGNDFQPLTTFVNGKPEVTYRALFSNETFLTIVTNIGSAFKSESNVIFSEDASDLYWYYRLDTTRLSIDQLDDLIRQCQMLQANFANRFGDITIPPPYPYILSGDASTPALEPDGAPGILGQYSDLIQVARIPMTITLCLILGLVLYFVATMTQLLVESQADVIALLRGRGASHAQVLGTLLTQGVGLGLIVLLLGPFLSLLLVNMLTHIFLSPNDYGAFSILSVNPWQAMLRVLPVAGAVVGVSILTMMLATRAVSTSTLFIKRRENSRKTRLPLWQHLNLDIAAAIIAVTGYILSRFITSITSGDVLNPAVQVLIASPLSLVAPAFLVVAGILLLLRFATPLLRLGTRFAVRGRAAAPLLALAQMARTPHQAVRMTLLLAFAISFSLFTLVFSASQEQHVPEIAAYQAGADMSGRLSDTISTSSLRDETATYRHLPGVLSASLGYEGDAVSAGNEAEFPLQIRAVDVSTFAQTAIWTSQESSVPLTSLMAQLSVQRSLSRLQNVVPAIVDALVWQNLHLRVGTRFFMQISRENSTPITIPCVTIAQVQHIPTTNNSLGSVDTPGYHAPGGILVDYQSYTALYQRESGNNLPINYLWLRTQDSPALLSKLRNLLHTAQFSVDPLYDRRALTATLQHDPLLLDLVGVLTIGTVTALLLTLAGNLTTSWLSVRARLTNFALLRALGTTTRQIASVLLWEQSLVYITALLLGLLFGVLLSATFVPVLVFSSTLPGTGETSSAAFYATQHLLPVNLVLPGSLLIALLVLVAIYTLSLWLMAQVISRPLMSQTLRLNED